jgi:hypothetical protein
MDDDTKMGEDANPARLVEYTSRFLLNRDKDLKRRVSEIASEVSAENLAQLSLSSHIFYLAALDPHYVVDLDYFKLNEDIAKQLQRHIKSEDMHIFLGCVPFCDINDDDRPSLLAWLMQEIGEIQDEREKKVRDRVFSMFSKFPIHPRRHQNLLSLFRKSIWISMIIMSL